MVKPCLFSPPWPSLSSSPLLLLLSSTGSLVVSIRNPSQPKLRSVVFGDIQGESRKLGPRLSASTGFPSQLAGLGRGKPANWDGDGPGGDLGLLVAGAMK